MDFLDKTHLGGIPFEWDDLRWMDNAQRDALTRSLIGLAGGLLSFIVEGCEFIGSGAQVYVNKGYIMWKGQLLKVNLHQVTNPELVDYHYVTIVDTPNSEGSEVTESNDTVECYIERRLVVENGANPQDPNHFEFNSTNFPRLSDITSGWDAQWQNLELSPDNNTPFVTETENLTAITSGTYKYKKLGKGCFFELNLVVQVENISAPFKLALPNISPQNQGFHCYGVFVLKSESSNVKYLTDITNSGDMLEFTRTGGGNFTQDLRVSVSFFMAID